MKNLTNAVDTVVADAREGVATAHPNASADAEAQGISGTVCALTPQQTRLCDALVDTSAPRWER